MNRNEMRPIYEKIQSIREKLERKEKLTQSELQYTYTHLKNSKEYPEYFIEFCRYGTNKQAFTIQNKTKEIKKLGNDIVELTEKLFPVKTK